MPTFISVIFVSTLIPQQKFFIITLKVMKVLTNWHRRRRSKQRDLLTATSTKVLSKRVKKNTHSREERKSEFLCDEMASTTGFPFSFTTKS